MTYNTETHTTLYRGHRMKTNKT